MDLSFSKNTLKELKNLFLFLSEEAAALCSHFVIEEKDQVYATKIEKSIQEVIIESIQDCVNQNNFVKACSILRFVNIKDEQVGQALDNAFRVLVVKINEKEQNEMKEIQKSNEKPPILSELKSHQIKSRVYEALLSLKNLDLIKKYSSFEDEELRKKVKSELVTDSFKQLSFFLKQEKVLPSDEKYAKELSQFWRQFFTELRVSQEHCLEFVLERGLKLLSAQRFDDVEILMKPFVRLRPLLLILGWSNFDNNVEPLQKMFDKLWHGFEDMCADPFIKQICLTMDYEVQFSLFAAQKYLELKEFPVNFPKLQQQKIFESQENQNMKKENINALASFILKMMETHSLLFVLEPILPVLNEDEVIERINSKQILDIVDGDQMHDFPNLSHIEKQRDYLLIRGYYAIRAVLNLFEIKAKSAFVSVDQASQSTAKLQVHLDSIYSQNKEHFVRIIEIIFAALFIKKNHFNQFNQDLSNIQNIENLSKNQSVEILSKTQNIEKETDPSKQKSSQKFEDFSKFISSSFSFSLLPTFWREDEQEQSDKDIHKHIENEGEQFVADSFLTKTILKVLEQNISKLEEIEAKTNQTEQTKQEDFPTNFKTRIEILLKFIREGNWRYKVVTSFKHFEYLTIEKTEETTNDNENQKTRTEKELAQQGGPKEFMALFLASPESLLNISLRETQYPLSKEIYNYYKMPEEFIKLVESMEIIDEINSLPSNEQTEEKTWEYVKKMDEILRKNTNQQETNLDRFVRDEESFEIFSDIAISSSKSAKVSSALLSQAKEYLENVPQTGLESLKGLPPQMVGSIMESMKRMIGRYEVLQKHFPNDPLQDILSSLVESLPPTTDTLEKYLLRRSAQQKAFGQLVEKVREHEDAVDKEKVEDVESVLREVSKAFRDENSENQNLENLENQKIENSENLQNQNNYLARFVDYILMVGDALKNTQLQTQNYLTILQQSIEMILLRLAYQCQEYSKAEKLANSIGIDLVSVIIEKINSQPEYEKKEEKKVVSTFVEPTQLDSEKKSIFSSFPLTLKIVSFIGEKNPLLATLSCLFLAPKLENTNEFLDYALTNSADFPSLNRWVQQRKQAYETFTHVYLEENKQDIEQEEFDQVSDWVYSNNPQDVEQFYSKSVERLSSMGKYEEAIEIADENLEEGAPDHLLEEFIKITNDEDRRWECIVRIKDIAKTTHLVFRYLPNWDLEKCLDSLILCRGRLSHQDMQYESVQKRYAEMCLYRDILGFVKNKKEKMEKNKNNENLNENLENENLDENLENENENLENKKLPTNSPAFASWQTLENASTHNLPQVIADLVAMQAFSLARRVYQMFHTVLDSQEKSQSLENHIDLSDILYLLKVKKDQSKAIELLISLKQRVLEIYGELIQRLSSHEHKLFILEFILNDCEVELKGSLENVKSHELGLRILINIPQKLQSRYETISAKPLIMIENLLMDRRFEEMKTLFHKIPELKQPCEPLLKRFTEKAIDFRKYMEEINQEEIKNNENNNENNNEKIKYENYDNELNNELKNQFENYQQQWLTGDDDADEKLRREFAFPEAPSLSLTKAFLDLFPNPQVAGTICLEICDKLSTILSTAKDHNAFLITNVLEQLYLYAKFKFTEGEEDVSFMVSKCDTFLSHVELLKKILSSNVKITISSISDFSNDQIAKKIRNELIREDYLQLAVDVATKCGIDPNPVWETWGFALLKLGKYPDAREKFKYYFGPMSDRSNISFQMARHESNFEQKKRTLENIISILELPLDINIVRQRDSKVFSAQLEDSRNLSFAQRTNSNDEQNENTSIHSDDSNIQPNTQIYDITKYRYVVQSKVLGKNLDKDRYDECIYYLKTYGTHKELISFIIRHGLIQEAISIIIRDSLELDLIVNDVLQFCIRHGWIPRMKKAFNDLQQSDQEENDPNKKKEIKDKINTCLLDICKYLYQHKYYNILYSFQTFMQDDARAGLTQIKLFQESSTYEKKKEYLTNAEHHFRSLLEKFEKNEVSFDQSESFNRNTLDFQINTIKLQLRLLKFWFEDLREPERENDSLSLFSKNDEKEKIAVQLILKNNFDLSYEIIQLYHLPTTRIYSQAVEEMTRKKDTKLLTAILKHIKFIINNDEWDTILMKCIQVYHNFHQDPKKAEKYIQQLNSAHNKVLAYIMCQKLRNAYVLAAKSRNVEDVQTILNEAEQKNIKPVINLCKKWLAENKN
eukprot:Anaeramoba_ignava/c21408_g2_i1.p1 GENE.c21408_g2_i1~~c21408_g2_i1.p1  ORF type:complete len:2426 (-),score=768.19 c21408_g2_i1:54-6635(-)